MKVAIIIGTRPEFIKFYSVIHALEQRKIDFFIIHTGQHYSPELDQFFFADLELPEPKYRLSVSSSAPLGEWLASAVEQCVVILSKEKPDIVLVEGDTNSVLAGALASVRVGIQVGHIEAGLRSNNGNMTEERNRIVVSHLASFLFAPTTIARDNLLKEGFQAQKVMLTGNTIADAIKWFGPIADSRSTLRQLHNLTDGGYFLATIHRAEATDVPKHLSNIVEALNRIARRHGSSIFLPMHPRTKKNIEKLNLRLDPLVIVSAPIGYFDFLSLLKHCRLVITDSGGVQEEACILGIPAVTVRGETERPETVDLGANIVAGYGVENIIQAADIMLARTAGWHNPYGEECGLKIVQLLMTFLHAT